MKKILTILIAMVIAVLSTVQPGFGAEVNLRTRVGFGGYLVPGTIMPVQVEINRTVAAGRLEIISPGEAGAFSIIDSFPVQNSKRIEASVFINEKVNNLKIRLISGDQILVETGLNPAPKMFPGNLILTVKAPAAAQHAIERALLPAEPVLVAPLQITDLPGTALNYDGVSGLALSDPGPVLTPVQVEALKVWLAGGGRMALGAARSGQSSLLSVLGIDAEVSEWSFYPVGFGGITAFRGEFTGLKQSAPEWRGLLNLRPYTEISRLMVSRLFPELKTASSRNSTGRSVKAASYLSIILILWVISGLIIVIPAKGNRMALLICFGLLWSVAAYPIGDWLAGIWNRGAEINSRTILLPEVGWMLTDVQVRFNCYQDGKTINLQSSPWGGRVAFGETDHGIVQVKSQTEAFAWSHRFSLSKTVAKTAGPGWVNLNGWFPYNQTTSGRLNKLGPARKAGSNSETVIWKGQHFYRKRSFNASGNWEEIEQTPDWLREENQWLAKLYRLKPEIAWLIGCDFLPESVLKIENGVWSEGLWALPLSEEALK